MESIFNGFNVRLRVLSSVFNLRSLLHLLHILLQKFCHVYYNILLFSILVYPVISLHALFALMLHSFLSVVVGENGILEPLFSLDKLIVNCSKFDVTIFSVCFFRPRSTYQVQRSSFFVFHWLAFFLCLSSDHLL